jgi:hypothetical protein
MNEIKGYPVRVREFHGGDWRLTFETPSGANVTMHRGATAKDVALYLEREERDAADRTATR